MPPFYVAVHLLLTLAAAWIAWRVALRSQWARGSLAAFLGLAVLGLVTERNTDLAWTAMSLGWPDLVFFTNLSLEGVAVLLALMWRQDSVRKARGRALGLSVLAVGAALWSYGWYFAPVPPGLSGVVDRSGYCRQTTEDSCSAAAAVMVLHAHGIPATESETAALCLTRARHGTTPLGTFRGLAIKGRPHGLRPVLVRAGNVPGLAALPGPGIVSIGVNSRAPEAIARRLEEYGWQREVRHAVVIQGADPNGAWIDVADPSYGRERWPNTDPEELRNLWDGLVLVLR